jgi:hypothetical protein
MTIKSFFIFSFLQWLLFLGLKVLFFNHVFFANANVQYLVFWLCAAVLSAAMVRRLGVLNFLEAFFIVLAWVLGDLFLDLLITSAVVGVYIFQKWQFWMAYLFYVIFILFAHKKRHILIRHELRARRAL